MSQITLSNARLVLSRNKKWYNHTSQSLFRLNKQLLSSSSLITSNNLTQQHFRYNNPNQLITRNYHQWSNNNINSILATLPSIPSLLSKIPKGFENFYPKDKKSAEESNKKNEKQKKSNNNKGSGPEPESGIAGTIIAAMVAYTIYQLLNETTNKQKNGSEITWSEFRNHLLENDLVSKIVVINKKIARVYLHDNYDHDVLSEQGGDDLLNHEMDDDDTIMEMNTSSTSPQQPQPHLRPQMVYHFNIGSVESFEEKLRVAQKELKFSPRDYVPVQYINETNYATEIIKSLPMIIGIGALFYFTRRMQNMNPGKGAGGGGGGMGNIFQVGKSNAKKIKKEDVNVDFSHVAGCQEAKNEIMEFVDFLQDSTLFTKLGAKIPKGALLCGPPGTGKTLLAKAVAGEANVPFYSISGSDFVEMFVGVGPSRVRDLFKEARANAPCIVFIDEIDAVGRKRRQGGFSGGNDERENTLNQLLVEMDGFNTSTAVVVLAGTNRIDILDSALTRPGRFDRTITVDLPDIQGRRDIFKVHLKGITLEEDNQDDIAHRLAGLTPGFSGADIANLCNEAAIVAARRKADSVSIADFEKATDRIIGGLESHKIMSKEEKEIVAHHEAGHAIAGWFLEHCDPLLKLTIIPRSSGALGFAQYLPKEVYLRTEAQIMDVVCMALAGRASEEIFFGKVTTGAADDLRRVTSMVYNMIKIYGMNHKLGQLAFPSNNNNSPFGEQKVYSDATAQAMDEEAKRIVDAAYNRALELITEKKTEVEKVSQMLLEKETITHDDVYDLIGPRPFEMDKAYKEFVTRKKDASVEEKSVDVEENNDVKDDVEDDSNGPTLTPGLA